MLRVAFPHGSAIVSVPSEYEPGVRTCGIRTPENGET